MKSQALFTVFGLLLPIGTACSSNSSSPSTSSTGGASSTCSSATGGSTVVETCPTIPKDSSGNYQVASSTTNNYTFTSNVTLGAQQTVAPKTTLTFDWNTLTTDMYKETINPKSGIGNMALALFRLTRDQLQTKINQDSFLPSDRTAAATYLTGGTVDHCSTADLNELGNTIPESTVLGYLDDTTHSPSEYTYMVMVGAGNEYGKDARMLVNFAVSSSSTNTTISIKPDSATADFKATLDKLTPITVPVGAANVVLDWTTLTTNAMAHTVDPYNVTKVMVASFTQSVCELQQNSNFLNLETLAVNEWVSTELAGTTVVLTTLKDANGNAFAGIDATHTWIIALENTDSLNPAPWYLSVLKPCNG
jgi:hypothetical protein